MKRNIIAIIPAWHSTVEVDSLLSMPANITISKFKTCYTALSGCFLWERGFCLPPHDRQSTTMFTTMNTTCSMFAIKLLRYQKSYQTTVLVTAQHCQAVNYLVCGHLVCVIFKLINFCDSVSTFNAILLIVICNFVIV